MRDAGLKTKMLSPLLEEIDAPRPDSFPKPREGAP